MTSEENVIMCANNLLQTRKYLELCKEIQKLPIEVEMTLLVMDELYRRSAAKILKDYEQEQQAMKDYITFLEERGLG